MAKCKACGAEIRFIATSERKYIPCDTEPMYYRENSTGTKRIVTPNGMVLRCEYEDKPNNETTGVGYMPHWANCPEADSFRRR